MGAKLSGSGGGKYDLGQNSEINVTPFVDVMLVLLIIFMVAAPLATVSVEVKLPPAYAKPAKQSPSKQVFISLQKDQDLFVGDRRTTLEELPAALKIAIPRRDVENERIYIRADSDVLYKDFMHLVNKLQDHGYYSVALVGEDAVGNKKGK